MLLHQTKTQKMFPATKGSGGLPLRKVDMALSWQPKVESNSRLGAGTSSWPVEPMAGIPGGPVRPGKVVQVDYVCRSCIHMQHMHICLCIVCKNGRMYIYIYTYVRVQTRVVQTSTPKKRIGWAAPVAWYIISLLRHSLRVVFTATLGYKSATINFESMMCKQDPSWSLWKEQNPW